MSELVILEQINPGNVQRIWLWVFSGLVVMPPQSAGVQSAGVQSAGVQSVNQQPRINRQGNTYLSSRESFSWFTYVQSFWLLSYVLFTKIIINFYFKFILILKDVLHKQVIRESTPRNNQYGELHLPHVTDTESINFPSLK